MDVKKRLKIFVAKEKCGMIGGNCMPQIATIKELKDTARISEMVLIRFL